MNIIVKTREEYFAQAGERRGELEEIDAFIRDNTPDMPAKISDGMTTTVMLGYGEQQYQTKSMKEPARWPVIALALQKNYFSIYVCVVLDGEYVAERFAAELGKVSVGKSCIRFKKFSDVNHEVLAELLTDINARFAAGESLYGI